VIRAKLMRPRPALAAALLLCGVCWAGITHDAKARLLWVTDFPPGYPCTPRLLLAADRANGWGRVSYDEAAGVCVVDGDLLIGDNDGTVSCFQVGSPETPRETLVVRGNLYVAPHWVEGENAGKYWQAPVLANRLTLGSAEDASVRAALKFDNRKRGEFGLFVGDLPPSLRRKKASYGGQIRAFNSVITAARQDAAHACSGFRFTCQEAVLENSELSWAVDDLAYGLHVSQALKVVRVRGVVFANAGGAISNGAVTLSDCVFRNLKCAVSDSGAIDATLVNCVFENNERNWILRFTPNGIVCVDCSIGAPTKGDVLKPEIAGSLKQKQYGSVTSRRHVVAEVVDEQGRPVGGAELVVRCEQGGAGAVENARQTTNAHGRTPGQGEKGALLLTEWTVTATDDPAAPKRETFSYELRGSAPGRAPAALAGFAPDASWKAVRLTLGGQAR